MVRNGASIVPAAASEPLGATKNVSPPVGGWKGWLPQAGGGGGPASCPPLLAPPPPPQAEAETTRTSPRRRRAITPGG